MKDNKFESLVNMKNGQFEILVNMIKENTTYLENMIKENTAYLENKIKENTANLENKIEEVKNENKETRKELDRKTDVLLQFITKSATGLRNEFKNGISESESHLNQSINSVRDELRTYKQVNSREHQTIIDTMEERYSAHEKDIVSLDQGLNTVYALAKLNKIEHDEYDRILAQNGLK